MAMPPSTFLSTVINEAIVGHWFICQLDLCPQLIGLIFKKRYQFLVTILYKLNNFHSFHGRVFA